MLFVGARAGQRGSNHIRGEQRTGRDVGAERVGDERQIDDTRAADAATAKVLGYEERCPAEFRALAPVVTFEAGVRPREFPHLGNRALALQELQRRVAEELLVVGQRDFHRALLSSCIRLVILARI